MGGRGVLDFKPGLGLYVRDGKTQPNFAAVMRDHPEGIGNAVQNSKKMQSMMSGGFIPNFAGFDPLTMLLSMQGFGGQTSLDEASMKIERQELARILRERRAAQQLLAQAEKAEIKDQEAINRLKQEQVSLQSQENKQRASMNSQMPVLARNSRGNIVGGVGGAMGRFGSRYGSALMLGAPLLADTASQFIGNENTAGGRAAKAGVSGLGTIASYAGLGSMIAPGYGTAIGAGVGGIMAAYDVFQKLNDIMPDVAKRVEAATEKFNNISSATQTMSVSLETLSSIENRADLSAQTRVQLRMKAEEDFAKSISQLDQVLPGAGKQITDLYTKIGDTAELRQKITQLQTEAQRESKGFGAAGSLLTINQKANDLVAPKWYQQLTRLQMTSSGASGFNEQAIRAKNVKDLTGIEKAQYNQQIQSGGMQLYELFGNLGKNGPISSEQIGQIQAGLKNGKGLDGIKSLLDSLTENGDYSKIIAEDLDVLLKDKTLDPMIEAWKKFQERQETIRKALDEANQQIITGGRDIKDLASYGRAFSGTTPISAQALGRIDYSSIGEQFNISRGQAFGQQVQTQFEQLGQEIGNTSENVKYFSKFSEEAGNIQKDLANKTITLSQATERLKLVFDKISFEKNAPFMFSGERAQARQGILERELKQGNFKEGFDPLTSFFDKFGDNAATTADKINKSFANLADNLQTGFEDAFGAFVDGTKTADQAFQDMLLSISQQIIKEQFSIGMRSLLGGLTGGGGFGEQGGGGGGLLGNILGSLFGGKSQGGIIKKYSSGGHVQGGSGMKDDVPAMLTDGEYVLRKSAVNKYGKGMLDMLNQGGMVKGYAGGGSVNALLNNSYDFFGANGEKLTQNYTPEAFKTTVNAPSELGNVPALTGKFNISDMLSSRALMDENNPMNALRTQRFLGMQGYQEQVSNFKTGYNEQMRQVEEQRKAEQERVNQINSQLMAQYNQKRTGTLIGGLLNVGFSLAGPLLGGLGGGGLGGLFGGGGGGLGGVLGGLQGIAGAFLQGITGGGGGGGTQTMSDYQKAQIAKQQQAAITGYQYNGFGGMDFSKQTNLFPQFGSQGGFGGGMGGNNFGPSSSIGGFQFGVGLGAPAGFQTYTQNAQQDYLMNFASPVAPTAPGRGNLVYDFLNQNSNPFGYNRGYAKGGLVRGYYDGGMPDPYLPASVLNLRVKGSDGNTYTLAQLGLTTNNTYADLQKKAGQGFGGGYNNPEVIQTLNSLQSIPGFQRVTAVNDLYHQENKKNSLHTAGFKGDFTFENQNQLNKQQKQMIVNQLKEQGLTLGKDYKLNFERTGGTAPHFDFELKKSGITKVAAMNMGMPAGNIAGTNTPAVMAGVGLPSKTSAMYSMTPDMNRNQSTFFKEAGEGVFGAGLGVYGLRKIIDSKLGQKGLMSTLRSAYGGALESSFLPERKYGSNFVKPATARDSNFVKPATARDLTESRFGRRGSLGLKNLPVKKITDSFDFGSRKIGTYLQDFVSMYGQSIKKFNANDSSIVGRGYITSDPNLTVKGKYGSPGIRGSLLYGNSYGAAASTGGREALGSGRALKALLDNPNLSQAALYRVPVNSPVYAPFGIEDAKNPIGNLKTKNLPYDAELLIDKKNKPIARLLALGDEAVSTSQSPILKSIMRNQDKISKFGASTQNFNQPPPMNRAAGEFSKVMPKQLVDPSEAANILKYAQSGALKPSLLSRSLSGLKGFGAGILKGAAFAPATEFLTPPSLGPTQGTTAYEIEMGYRNLSGQLTPLGERVLGTDNTSVQIPLFRNKQGEIPGDRSTYTPERIAKAATQQDFLGMNQQSKDQILPFFQNLQNIADQTSGAAPNLYQSIGSLYDAKNKGDYSSLASKFSSFYGNDLKNRYTPFGEKGFNSYLNYIGANPFSTLSQFNAFKYPMTPGMYSPFAFGSQNFGGFGGTGYQSGFNSLGNVFSNWFSTGSRLGVTPSWASRATGGMIYGGTSTKDDVPAMLMGGEYVVRKDAVDRFGQPFFDRLNRGQVSGFAEGGPVGTVLPSVGGGSNQQDNSRNQFVESITKLVKSLEQLNKGIEEQNRGTKDQAQGGANTSDSTGASGVTNNISINVNVDQNGKTTDSTKQEDQSSGTKEETDQEKFKKTMERSRVLAELLRQQVLKVIVEEQRPGGVLYQGSKGRDMGR